ncbi:hypothetical protein [Limnofasciculus baicalensis]|uniref:Uncharacterized protein n=1 Tax=Limnofasciculus baicalensis BBK-W-15 TaxID=2699891 RepID=A0AAE3GT51_9CYAN|nr:hypothetical protein [Limnofasciculus baicalensis]MCP2729441.1 hypothetical protein [Limnofasciculus baicalensis BBK-W-15]
MNYRLSIPLIATVTLLSYITPASANPVNETLEELANNWSDAVYCGVACMPFGPQAAFVCGLACDALNMLTPTVRPIEHPSDAPGYSFHRKPDTIFTPSGQVYDKTGTWSGIPGYSNSDNTNWVNSSPKADMIFTPSGEVYEKTGSY